MAALSALQAGGVSLALANIAGVVAISEWLFVVSTILTMTAAVAFLAWLVEQITLRGIGNGIALILLTDAVTAFSRAVGSALAAGPPRGASGQTFVTVLLLAAALMLLIAAVELARRKLRVDFPERRPHRGRHSGRLRGARPSSSIAPE